MSDDKKKQGYQDDAKIADDEFPYWCRKWNIQSRDLQKAIDETGSRAVSVIECYLRDDGMIK